MNKDIVLVLCVVIALGSVGIVWYSTRKQDKLVKSLEEERYSRMVAEESSQKSSAKLATLENQLKSIQDKMAKLKGILDQEKNVNEDLKGQYAKLARAKAELDDKLRAAMEEKQAQAVVDQVVEPVAVAAGAQ